MVKQYDYNEPLWWYKTKGFIVYGGILTIALVGVYFAFTNEPQSCSNQLDPNKCYNPNSGVFGYRLYQDDNGTYYQVAVYCDENYTIKEVD